MPLDNDSEKIRWLLRYNSSLLYICKSDSFNTLI